MRYANLSSCILALVSLSALLLMPTKGRAQGFFPRIVNPKTYASPSGEYTVTVDPNDRSAEKGAAVLIQRKGQPVWSGKMDCALLNAGITDDGTVGGYGFTERAKDKLRSFGDFHVIILDSNGKIRLDQRTPREMSRFPDAEMDPHPAGLIFDPQNDRMVVRVHDPDLNRGIESWWVYRLSTATPLTKIEPQKRLSDPETQRSIIDAQAVSGTPLTLVHWWRYARSSGTLSLGASFTLIDLDCKPVWSMELPKDYTLRNEDAQDRLMNEIRANGAILRADQTGHFDLRFVAEAQRVGFEVTRATDGKWQVAEIGRTPYLPPRPVVTPEPVVPARKLSYLGAIVLPTEYKAGASPVRDLDGFVSAGLDRFAFLRREAKGPDTFIVVDTAGKLIHQVKLDKIPLEPNFSWSGYIWVGGSRFLLTRSRTQDGGKACAWYVDAATGAVSPLREFNCPPIKRIAAFPDGGFVVLATIYAKYTLWDEVHAFTAQGKRTWSLTGDGGYSPDADPERLFSPIDLTVTPEGSVAILDNIQNNVKIFARNGRYRKTLNLEKAWGREPSYLTHVRPDTAGGFLIFDFTGSPSIIHARADGTVRHSLPLRPGVGQENGEVDDILIGSDRKIWLSDGHALKRLTDSGRVDRTLGDTPTADHLGHIDDLKMTANGRLYALDDRAGAIHIFDAAGKRLAICRSGKPAPSDMLSAASVHPTETGEVYLQEQQSYLRFSADGRLLGVANGKKTASTNNAAESNRHAAFWTQGLDFVKLIDEAGVTRTTVERLPNRNWFSVVHDAAWDTTGSLAVLTSHLFGGEERVSLYTANGTPLRSFSLPASLKEPYKLAFDGKQIIVGGKEQVMAFDASGKALWQFQPALSGEKENSWQVFLVFGGKELRLYNGVRTIYRYAVPQLTSQED